MMAALKEWLMGVIAVSVLCAAADSLMPGGSVKKVGRFACGLVMLCVMLEPLAALRGSSITGWLEEYAYSIQTEEENLKHQVVHTQKAVIEEYCAAYISDKAAELGVTCRVEVECTYHADGLYLPQCARLWGNFSDVEQSRLTQLLETQLGIPIEEQTYYCT